MKNIPEASLRVSLHSAFVFAVVFMLISSLLLASMHPTTAFAASVGIIAPPDKSLSTSSSTTLKVGLGTPKVTGSGVTVSRDGPSSVAAPGGAAAYWSFDNDLEDQTANGNDGVASGNARVSLSYMGRSLLLDGSGDYVSVNSSPSLQLTGAFTLSVWLKFDSLTPAGTYIRILEKGTTDNRYWMFYVKDSKKIGFGFLSGGVDVNVVTTRTGWQVGKWYHIVGTYDPSLSSNNVKIYVDGTLDNQKTKLGGVMPKGDTQPLRIGTRAGADWDYWKGEIDELRIYKRAISTTEVKDLGNSPFVTLPLGTNIIKWTGTDGTGNSASAIQVVSIKNPSVSNPVVTTLAINGIRYLDNSTNTQYVSSKSHFNLAVNTSASSSTESLINWRYFPASDLYSFRPDFTQGNYFRISGSDGEYIAQFYGIDANDGSKSEIINQKNVILDNTPPVTTSNVIDSSVVGNLRLTAVDNSGGSGVGQKSLISGIFYKLDTASSYTFVQSNTVDLTDAPSGLHTLSFYAVDNLGNKENVKSTVFSKATFTFCSVGCDYNNLQTAINSLPSNGGLVYIAAGNYVMSNTITLKSGTALQFSDQSSIYFRGDSKPVFKGSGVSNINIIGGDITAERTGVKAFSFTNSNGITVDGAKIVLVKGGNSNGFHCIDCKNAHALNMNVDSATRSIDVFTSSGINDGATSGIWVENGTFTNSSIEGIKINDSNDVHILNNTVRNTPENGIDIGWNTKSEVVGNKLYNTGVPNGAAIHTDSANGANVTNNYVDTTGMNAIPVYRASHINVIGNTILNAGDQAISVIDSIETSSYVKVLSNHVIAPAGHGIYVSPNQYQVEIAYNTVEQLADGKKGILIIWSNNATVKEHDNTVL